MPEHIILEERLHLTLEESLRKSFETMLEAVFDQLDRQALEGQGGKEFLLITNAQFENGQSFKMTIEFQPPTIPMIPSRN